MGGVVLVTSAWVFCDAHDKLLPKPLRWGLLSLLVWIVVFPWYLARRRDPVARCPFIEASSSSRLLLALLVISVLQGIVIIVLKQLSVAIPLGGH